MSNEIIIRNANSSDVNIIRELIHELAVYEKLEHEMNATEEDLKNTLFENKHAEVLIAEYDSMPVGFALFFHNYSTFLGKPGLYLEDLFVKETYRGRGIGKRLLIKLAKIATERNCGRFEWSVLDWNKPSIKFYLKMGAVPMDDWTVYRVSGRALDDLSKMDN